MKSTLAISLLAFGGAAMADCGSRAVMSTKREDGTRVGIVLTDAQLSKAPSWSPDKGEPPLSVAFAGGLMDGTIVGPTPLKD